MLLQGWLSSFNLPLAAFPSSPTLTFCCLFIVASGKSRNNILYP